MASSSVERLKDVLLEHILRDVKGLQNSQSEREQMEDVVTLSNSHVQGLCEHLDRILMHGLRSSEMGYWAAVGYFTRTEAVTMINNLPAVKTNVGRGRAWLYLALNEQSLESYVRMFVENQDVMQNYYLRDSFVRDLERLVILQTLTAALDFIFFDLPIESIYFDYGAIKATSTVGSLQHNITPDIAPTFISRVIPGSKAEAKSSPSPQTGASPSSGDGFSITGMIGSVFSKDKKSSSPATPTRSRGGVAGTAGDSPALGRGGDEGVVSSVELEREELRGSFSPHRTLAQTEHGTGLATGLAESDSSSNSPHSKARMPQASVEGEEEELVLRAPRSKSSKSKAKKKKKKKKSKTAESAEPKTEPSGVSVDQDQIKPDTTDTTDTTDPQRGEETTPQRAAVEPDGGVEQALTKDTDSPSKSRRREGEEDMAAKRALMSSPEGEEEMSYEQWAVNKTDMGTLDREDLPPSQDQTGEFEEECDMGFEPGPLPPTHPQPEAGNKRLTLHEELELVNQLEMDAPVTPEGDGDRGEGTPPLEQRSQSDSQGQDTPTLHAEAVPIPAPSKVEEEQEEGYSTPPSETFRYTGSPVRPSEITEKDKRASDVEIDDTTRLVISLDILRQEKEELHRLVQVATPTGVGQQRTCYVLVTSHCTYILRKDGIEGNYSREISIQYTEYDHIVIGLGWQSLHLMYHDSSSSGGVAGGVAGESLPQKYIILTGSEAVSRGLVDSIRTLAGACPGFLRSIPLNKDDETRVYAIEKELIKLGSETNMDIEQYLLVNWEQLSGEGPAAASTGSQVGVARSGYLMVKTTNLLGIATWRQAYFVVRNGELLQFSSEEDDMPKNTYQIHNCGGCVRSPAESKPFALSVLGSDKNMMVVVAASNEEELSQWMVSLCEAVREKEMPGSPTMRKTCFFCALLLTQNRIHVLQEDWNKKTVELVTSCAVTDVNDISVDKSLPFYCTISYDHDNDQGLWLVCFNTEYELGKFEAALGGMWREEFQIDLQFSEVSNAETRQRAHRAVELMQGSKYRSDSMTRGRTEFTYSGHY